MSELINNSQKRKELLKHMILQLHAGEAPDLVRKRQVKMWRVPPLKGATLVGSIPESGEW
jgi:hypothetical protein